MKLRLRSTEPNLGESPLVDQDLKDNMGEGKTSSVLVPKMGLKINVGEDDDDGDECLMYPGKNEEGKSPNQYLLHYKNQSMMLKQEIMNQPNVPMTPTSADAKKDPEEEFFMLAVLALKMLHNE
jgi:hypothetical protein